MHHGGWPRVVLKDQNEHGVWLLELLLIHQSDNKLPLKLISQLIWNTKQDLWQWVIAKHDWQSNSKKMATDKAVIK